MKISSIVGNLVEQILSNGYEIGKYNRIPDTDLVVLKQNSSCWYVQVPVPENLGIPNNRKRLSTKIKIDGTQSFIEAATFGLELIFENSVLEKQNLPLYELKPTVKSIALKTIESIEQLKNKKSTHKDYIRILNEEVIPQLGDIYFQDLSLKDCDEFFKNKKARSSTRITLAKSAIDSMFTYAELNNVIRKRDRLDLSKLDIEKEQQPEYVTFRDNDFALINANINSFIDASRNKITRENRILFSFYMNFLKTTGIRTGEEATGVLWKNIYLSDKSSSGKDRIILHIDKGKNAAGRRVTRDICLDKNTIENLIKLILFQTGFHDIVDEISEKNNVDVPYHAGLVGMNPTNLLMFIRKSKIENKPIFSRKEKVLKINKESGEKESRFINPNFGDCFDQFKSFLDNRLSNEEITLYSFRHYFITEALIEGVDIHYVAKYCGTSVEMIEKHYSRLKSRQASEHMKKDLDLEMFKM